jgi:hypothetical protein
LKGTIAMAKASAVAITDCDEVILPTNSTTWHSFIVHGTGLDQIQQPPGNANQGTGNATYTYKFEAHSILGEDNKPKKNKMTMWVRRKKNGERDATPVGTEDTPDFTVNDSGNTPSDPAEADVTYNDDSPPSSVETGFPPSCRGDIHIKADITFKAR